MSYRATLMTAIQRAQASNYPAYAAALRELLRRDSSPLAPAAPVITSPRLEAGRAGAPRAAAALLRQR